MRIEEIHIDGFGVWSDRTWRDLGPGLNLFLGSNETGKTTMMAFIRAVLFGLERRNDPRRYEPLRGGNHGGWLQLQTGGKSIRAERKAGRHVRGTVVVHIDDRTGDESDLEKLLHGTTRTLYHNVFAIGLDELEQFHTLHESEIASHISSAGLGIGASRWARIQKDLESRRNALFLSRGNSSAIGVATRELEGVRDELERTEPRPGEYFAACEERRRLEASLLQIHSEAEQAAETVSRLERLRKARPLWQRRKTLETQLREACAVDQFPEGGVPQLNLLVEERRKFETEIARKEAENEKRRARRTHLAAQFHPQELGSRARALEQLRTLLPQRKALQSLLTSAVGRWDAMAAEKRNLDRSLDTSRPLRPLILVLVLLVLATAGAAGFVLGSPLAGVAILALTTLPLTFYHQRRTRHDGLKQQQMLAVGQLAAAARDVERVEADLRASDSRIDALAGRTGFDIGDIETEAAAIRKMTQISEELRTLDEAIACTCVDSERIAWQLDESARKINELLLQGGAASEAEFHERAGIFKQRQAWLREIARMPADLEELGRLLDVGEDARYDEEAARLRAIRDRLAETQREIGRVEERISVIERSDERSRALARQESMLARIDHAAEHWAILTLCRALFDETRKVYEDERQPEVVKHASVFFRTMTGGRYRRVIAPLGSDQIQVEREEGTRLSPEMLSRGTGEQLYLAMRLALIREYSRHLEPLPVVFDDIFVNFDPGRTRHTLEAVRDLSETHQILLFTCHPHLAAAVAEIVPGVQAFQLV